MRLGRPAFIILGAAAVTILGVASWHLGKRVPQTKGVDLSGRSSAAFSKLRSTFVENRGQADGRIQFISRGSGHTFSLTSERIILSFAGQSTRPVSLQTVGFRPSRAAAEAAETFTLGLRFAGSNPNVVLEGGKRAPGNVNYFQGSSPESWHANLANYEQVVYRQLWPGVDLWLTEESGALKYEFHLQPGASVDQIRLAYESIDEISLDPVGNLQVDTPAGILLDKAPVSYQEIDGARVPVESRYTLSSRSKNEYGFRVSGSYQRDRELVIDPGVDYSTFLGGTSDEIANGIAVDAAGNTYIVGYTQSPDYPTTPGAFDRTGATGNFADVFVAKLNPAGTALIYSTFIGGSNFDFGRAIAIDAAGNAYIAGQTKSSSFPTTSNAFDRSFNVLNCPRCGIDNYDAFVTKLNPSGSALVYSTFLGGATDIDDALAIAVDSTGNAYVAGETGSSDFPVTPGAFRTVRNGAYDAFVTKLNPSGSSLVYSTFIGGSEVEFPVRIKLDASNNAYVLGNTRSPNFPTTPGAFDTTLNGQFDTFVLKLNPAGSGLVYSTFLGGTGTDSAGGLAVGPAGNAYICGGTSSNDYPTTAGTLQPTAISGAFVTKLNSSGTGLLYSTYFGDPGAGCSGLAMTVDGKVWLTGGTASQSFPTTPDAFQRFYHPGGSGAADGFLSELDAAGAALLYSTYLGGIETDYGTDLGLDSTGNVYVTGITRSADFPTTAGALDRIFAGRLDIFWGDAFVTKLALSGTPPGDPPPPTVASIILSGLEGVGGNPVSATVDLTRGAQGNGAVVTLASSNPAVYTLPATLTIPAGSQSGAAAGTTAVVAVNTPVTITASHNGSSKSANFTVLPVPPPATLLSIGMFPDVVTGGQSTQGILAVTTPAGPSGFTANISSNNPVATVPATVTVPAGQTNVAFPIQTSVVTSSTALSIFASAGGLTRIGVLTVNPATPPVTNITLTVTATGRNGESVTSSPSGINVAVGSSMQASFPSGSGVILSVTHGRDAIWSGACSSGGKKTKTCTLSLNAPSAATANVQ